MRIKNFRLIVWTVLWCYIFPITAWAQQGEYPAQGHVQQFFVDGGPLVWVLLGLSLLTVNLMVQNILLLRPKNILPPELPARLRSMLQDSPLPAVLQYLEAEDSFFSRVLQGAWGQVRNQPGDCQRMLDELLEQESTRLFRKIEWLNLIGNVAPMIGLFGTVWGMINAFQGIVQAGGQPEPADLAHGISVALVTTWWGLVVAIPALSAYGFLRNRIESLMSEVELQAENILQHKHLRPVEDPAP